MTSTIEVIYQSGVNLYAVIRRRSDGFVWNTALNGGDGGFEAWNSGNWAQYAIPLAEQSPSGYYSAAYPSTIGAQFTSEIVYIRVGGSPAASDAPPFILTLSQGQGVSAVNGVAQDAVNMDAALSTQKIGAAVGSVPGPLSVTTNLTDTTDDVYLGRVIIWTSGAMIRQAAKISGYDGTTKVLTVLAWATNLTPSDGDAFVII